MTDTALVNLALAYLGEQAVNSLSQAVPAARAGAALLRPTAEQVLRRRPWSSALKRAQLQREQVGTPFGPRWRYQLPADYLKLFRYNDDSPWDAYYIEGDKLVTDDCAVEIVYVAYPDDFDTLDTMLVDVIALKLAASMAQVITQNGRAQGMMLQLYEQRFREAAAADARELSKETQSVYGRTVYHSPLFLRRYRSNRRAGHYGINTKDDCADTITDPVTPTQPELPDNQPLVIRKTIPANAEATWLTQAEVTAAFPNDDVNLADFVSISLFGGPADDGVGINKSYTAGLNDPTGAPAGALVTKLRGRTEDDTTQAIYQFSKTFAVPDIPDGTEPGDVLTWQP